MQLLTFATFYVMRWCYGLLLRDWLELFMEHLLVWNTVFRNWKTQVQSLAVHLHVCIYLFSIPLNVMEDSSQVEKFCWERLIYYDWTTYMVGIVHWTNHFLPWVGMRTLSLCHAESFCWRQPFSVIARYVLQMNTLWMTSMTTECHYDSRWWFRICFMFTLIWANDQIWPIFFPMGWNHQLGFLVYKLVHHWLQSLFVGMPHHPQTKVSQSVMANQHFWRLGSNPRLPNTWEDVNWTPPNPA